MIHRIPCIPCLQPDKCPCSVNFEFGADIVGLQMLMRQKIS